MKEDLFDQCKINTFDASGRKTGYQKHDLFDKQKTNLFRKRY